MPEAETRYEHPCPECGGSVTVLRHKPSDRTQRAIRIPNLIWWVLVVATLAYVSPWGQRWLADPFAIFSTSDSIEADRKTSTILIPVITASDVLDAPEASAQTLRERYESNVIFYENEWADAQIRFFAVAPFELMHDSLSHGFGGHWIHREAHTAFSDIRGITTEMGMDSYPSESIEPNYFGSPSNPKSGSALSKHTIRMNGGQDHLRRVFPVTIVLPILATWLVLLALAAIPSRLGMKLFRSWRTKLALLVLASVAVPAIGLNTTDEQKRIIPRQEWRNPNRDTSDWMRGEAFTPLMLDKDQDSARAQIITELAESTDPGHVLGFEVLSDHSKSLTVHTAQLAKRVPIMRVAHINHYIEHPSGSKEPIELPQAEQGVFKIRSSPLVESIVIAISSRQAISVITLNWINIVLMCGGLWILRRVLRFFGTRVAYRTQRQRVKRDQCIFCAYPLSQNALNLRHSSAVSNELSS